MDDYFPCFPVPRGGPIFSQSHGKELWVLLLEKAFAKIRGSYAHLRYGSSLDALLDLTGAPFFHFNLQHELHVSGEEGGVEGGKARRRALWDQLVEYDLWGYVMSGSTAGWDESSEVLSEAGSGRAQDKDR